MRLLEGVGGKPIKCSECGRIFYAQLRTNERELLDGFHGLCPYCDQMNFEALKGGAE